MSEQEVITEETVEDVAVESTTETAQTEEKAVEEKAFVDSMLESISDEDVKSHKMWDNLKGKSADEFAQYVKELKSFAGKKGDIPKQDASEEEWSEFYQKLGRPENQDAYEFGMNEEFKELVGEASPFFEQAIEGFKEQAFKLGASPEKAEALVDWYLDMVATQTKDGQKVMEEFNAEQDKQLRTELGDGYDGVMTGIKAMLKNNGMSDEAIAEADSAGVLKNPQLAVTLGKIASKFDDDPEIGHHQTKTLSGLHDQLNDVNAEVSSYIKSGEKIPAHISQKRIDLMNKLGENL